MEIYKDIEGFEGMYQVSNLGNVKSLKRQIPNSIGKGFRTISERIMKLYLDSRGYFSVRINKKTERIHVLSAMTFLGYTKGDRTIIVDHIDNNKLNNRLDNLQVITQRENASKDRIGGTSDFPGVCKTSSNKWQAAIWNKTKFVHIGTFEYEIDAHNAYQNKLKELEYGKASI